MNIFEMSTIYKYDNLSQSQCLNENLEIISNFN